MSKTKTADDTVKIIGIDYGKPLIDSMDGDCFVLEVLKNTGKRSMFILPEEAMLKSLMSQADVYMVSQLIGRELLIRSSKPSGEFTEENIPINDILMTIKR